MKALFILSEAPFPARNGITIPTSNHLRIFQELGIEVGVITPDCIKDKTAQPVKILDVQFKYRSKVIKLIDEALMRRPYFTYQCEDRQVEKVIKEFGRPDIIYYSPISMFEVAENVREAVRFKFGKDPAVVASISDCYTAVLREGLRANLAFITSKSLINYIRSYSMARYERRICTQSDIVYAQTDSDKLWLERIGVCSDKVVVLPNGVDSELFNVDTYCGKEFVFVGNFRSDYYVRKFSWFYDSVWKRIRDTFPDAKLHVYTGGAASEVVNSKTADDLSVIIHSTFVEKLADVYKGKTFCIAPIYKNYGFINKVAESMAAGLVVIGDKSAFNGMDVEADYHCIIAETAEQFLEKIYQLIADAEQVKRIGYNAKKFASINFSWDARRIIIKQSLARF